MLALATALALLLTALAGPFGHASESALPVATHVAAASLGDLGPGSAVVPPASVHPMQAAASWWWIPADQLPALALLASMLLGVAGRIAVPVRSQAPPPGRGPPQGALSR